MASRAAPTARPEAHFETNDMAQLVNEGNTGAVKERVVGASLTP